VLDVSDRPALPARGRDDVAVAGGPAVVHRLPFAAALAVLALAAAGPARALSQLPYVPSTAQHPALLMGHESVATADGALGTVFNPALVGLRYPSELLLGLTADEFGRDLRYDALWAGRGLGLRYTRWPGAARVAGATIAAGSRGFRLGWSAEQLRSDRLGSVGNDHRLGLSSRPHPAISFGATIDHLFEPRVWDRDTERQYVIGVAVRPLAMPRPSAIARANPRRSNAVVDESRFTVWTDAVTSENRISRLGKGDALGQFDWRFGIEMELVRGLSTRYAYETGTRLGSFSVVLRLPRLSMGGKLTGAPVDAGVQTGRAAGLSDYLPAPQLYRDAFATAPRTWPTYTLSLHSGEEPTVLVPPSSRRVGVVRVGGPLGDDDVSGFSLLYGSESSVAVKPLHERLERALDDPLTRGVLIELGGASNGAALEELRPRITRLRAAGKPVVAYLETGGGRGDLLLASACDRVFASEEAMFWQLGLRAERRYYRKFLEDWGVRIDRSSIGAYKSAYRTWSADSTPPADRESIEQLLDQLHDAFLDTVSAARGMDRERLATLLDGRQWPSEDLAAAGLIDSVGYREQALAELGRLAGLGARPRSARLAAIRAAERQWNVARGIAVVYASGGIELGESGNDLLNGPTLGAATLARQIEQAFRRRDVRAVVLRIESPGGSVLGSNLIHHALERMKRETKKRLVVSMGSVAASGGYFIALPGDRIFADRMTRTGSIGVVFVHPSLEGWYAKHGVKQEDFERGEFMRGGSFARDWDAAMQASADSAIARSYDRFVDRVAASRKLPRERVLESAQGRVWLGEDARERGLVDEIGGLEAATAWAREAAGIDAGTRLEPAEYRRPRPGLLQRLAGSWIRSVLERDARLSLTPDVRFEAGDDVGF